MRRRRRNPSGFWSWVSDHWFISGFFLFPALIAAPVAIVRALNPPAPPLPAAGIKAGDVVRIVMANGAQTFVTVVAVPDPVHLVVSDGVNQSTIERARLVS